MKAAMNSHVAQERHTMFQSSADNVRSRLSVMLKELDVSMNDKADEVYIAMRRDYNSVLGGGEVPQSGEILPKTQRLVRKEMMRIIGGVERLFQKIAGLEVKDEDDEDEKVAPINDDEDRGLSFDKEEKDEDIKVEREASPSGQLRDEQQMKREVSSDESMANADSDRESETKLEDTDGSESSAGSESESD